HPWAARGCVSQVQERHGRQARVRAGPRLCRYDNHDGTPDLDLVALLQMLGGAEAAPVEPGAVGRAEVLDEPQGVGDVEAGVVAGSELMGDEEGAVADCRGGGTEAVADVREQIEQCAGEVG